MDTYTIENTSVKLGLSKDTLRYYDRLGIVSPQRGENKYRYYSEADIVNLMFVRIMQYADFSLREIKVALGGQNCTDTEDCDAEALAMLKDKQEKARQEIRRLRKILKLFDFAIGTVEGVGIRDDKAFAKLISTIFSSIEKLENKEG
ncbi:transcriptional regulator [Clostridia bacterium]|nr:transcriptional regulator [Clostridia bacterium]